MTKAALVTLMAALVLSLPTQVFARDSRAEADIPSSPLPPMRRIQVGAFRSSAAAQRAFDTLQNAGLNPIFENHSGFIRVVLPGIEAGRVPSILPLVRHAGFRDVWIREEPDALFRLQVGSFRDRANAEAAFDALQTRGLKPAYEDRLDYRRVVLPGVSSRDLPAVLDTAYLAGFRDVWIRPEPSTTRTVPPPLPNRAIGPDRDEPDAEITDGEAADEAFDGIRAPDGEEFLTMVLRR